VLLIRAASVKVWGKDIDITKEGGALLDSLHPGTSPQLYSQMTRYQFNSREGTLELEAASIGLLKLVDEYIGRDATLTTEVVSDTRQTALHLSASLGFAQLLQELIMRGVNLDQQDFNGYTALHFAALYGHIDCARSLVDAGADSGITNKRGHTALEIALESNYHAVAAFLQTCAGTDSGSEGKDNASQSALVPKSADPSTFRLPSMNRTMG
jgi:ankyrin repeat protein